MSPIWKHFVNCYPISCEVILYGRASGGQGFSVVSVSPPPPQQQSLKADSHNASRFRSVTMISVHTVHRVQSPPRTARDRRPAIISIKHKAPFVF